MRRLKEADLYRPLLLGAEADGWLLYRLTDLSVGRKPFDIGGIAPDGRAVAVEAKRVSRDWPRDPFPWGIFAIHQAGWLRGYAARGGLAIAVLYAEDTKLCSAYSIRSLDVDDLGPRGDIPRTFLTPDNRGRYRGWPSLLRAQVLPWRSEPDG